MSAAHTHSARLRAISHKAWQGYDSPEARACCEAADAFDELVAVIAAMIAALDGKRNRFGKLEGYTTNREPLREFAVRYQIGGAADNIEQAVKVARAVIAKVQA